MKKILLILLIVLCLASFGFLAYNYMELSNYDKKINSINKDIKEMKESISDEEKLKKETEEKYNKFMEENKDKIEEIEKWQKQAEEVKALQ